MGEDRRMSVGTFDDRDAVHASENEARSIRLIILHASRLSCVLDLKAKLLIGALKQLVKSE
jgi:hypothetical protein